MMVLYVGEDLEGTTSHHRRTVIEEMWEDEVHVIDFNEHLPQNELMKSLFWRTKNHIALSSFNHKLNQLLSRFNFDLIWVDKGFFLRDRQISMLRENAKKLVFFTPDCFFFQNHVKAIQRNLSLFDLVITTKSFELNFFLRQMDQSKILLVNQGYTDWGLPSFEKEREKDVIFIGKHEKYRELCVLKLAEAGISVHVGGAGWLQRGRRLIRCGVHVLEADIRGEDYKKAISRSKIGLGLLAKSFPELHTTRTFEIPYFGAALATERNSETEKFFKDSEALFYDTPDDLVVQVQSSLESGEWRNKALLGQKKTVKSNHSWSSQMSRIQKALYGKS